MNYYNSNKHCCGGGDHHDRHFQKLSGKRDVCHKLGPFTAIDKECIKKPEKKAEHSALTMFPFASGSDAMVLTTAGNGFPSNHYYVAFGSHEVGTGSPLPNIDLGSVNNYAFSVQQKGALKAISASFTNGVGATSIAVTVHATIYRARAGENIFRPTAASVNLVIPIGTGIGDVISKVSSNFTPVKVEAGDRLLMVYSLSTDATTSPTLTGTASAGLTFVV